MNIFRELIHWVKYNELSSYPALEAFDPPAAMKRLRDYAREEVSTCNPWLRYFPVMLGVFFSTLGLASLLLLYFGIISALFSSCVNMVVHLGMLSSLLVAVYTNQRRLNRFIDAKIAEERNSGRWQTCIKCGYDLRASKDQCPECGASVYVLPPTNTL